MEIRIEYPSIPTVSQNKNGILKPLKTSKIGSVSQYPTKYRYTENLFKYDEAPFFGNKPV